MAKKKNPMALFEVISKHRDKNPDAEVTVPAWVKPNGQPDQQDQQAQGPGVVEAAGGEPASPEPETQTPAPRGRATASESPSRPALPTTSTWEPRPSADTPKMSDLPIWSTDGGRLTLSLNYVSCLVVSTGVLLLIITAFFLGRVTAPETVEPPGGATAAVKREVGKYYMVIQTLTGNSREARAEAEQIVKFLAENKEPAQVMLLRDNLIVWSLTPFDSPKEEEVIGHALFVQNELGAKYARKYGSKYKFLQPQKNGKLAPIMYQHKKDP